MSRSLAMLALSSLAACGGDRDPAWAVDRMWIEPDAGGIHGFQTWELYGPRWERRQRDRTYVCAVAVELVGQEIPCTDCQAAWEVTPELASSDCAGAVQGDPTWTRLRRLSLGLPPAGGGPAVGFADYGWGWEIHGTATADGASGSQWDGATPFVFEPEMAWPVGG